MLAISSRSRWQNRNSPLRVADQGQELMLRSLVGRSVSSLGPEEFQVIEDLNYARPAGPMRHSAHRGRILSVR